MYYRVVQVRVRPGRREEFLAGTWATAEASVRDEPGCLRVDVCEDAADPDRFVLYELYADEAALALHQVTPHVAAWCTVAERVLVPGDRTDTAGRLLVGHSAETWD